MASREPLKGGRSGRPCLVLPLTLVRGPSESFGLRYNATGCGIFLSVSSNCSQVPKKSGEPGEKMDSGCLVNPEITGVANQIRREDTMPIKT